MKTLTLWQPWATFIALNIKQFETRSWGTGYWDKLAIHAAKRSVCPDGKYAVSQAYDLSGGMVPRIRWQYPLGCIVAIAELADCREMGDRFISQQTDLELAVGHWQPGRFAWQMENVIALPESIPYRGSQGLRDVRPDTLKILMELNNGT